MIKRILVGLAGTPYTPVAIQRAVTLAAQHQAEVTGVTLLDRAKIAPHGLRLPIGEAAGGSTRKRLAIAREHVEQAVADFESACRDAGVPRRIVQETEAPFTKLIDLSRYHDLMIFGMRSVFEHDFLCDDPHAELVRLVDAGVRPLIAVSTQFRRVSRVMIAYGGSMEAAKAMKRFVEMRLWPDALLKIMTFDESPARADRLAHDAAEYCRAHGHSVEWQTNPGVAKDLLLSAATLWQADLLVMGNSARSVLLRRTLLGDTALEVLQNAEIPLFLCQ